MTIKSCSYFALALVAACHATTPASRTPTSSGPPPLLAGAPRVGQANSITLNFGDAVALATQFAGRDGAGERLRSGTWFDSVLVDPLNARKDSIELITSFRIGGSAIDGDSARVMVQYNVIAALERQRDSAGNRHTVLVDRAQTATTTMVLARTQSGWRVVRAPRTMRIFAGSYLADETLPVLTPSDRKRLERMLGS